jgi:hypothetical protein
MKKILFLFYSLVIISFSSCIKDIADTLTEVEGLVTDSRSQKPIAGFDVCLCEKSRYDINIGFGTGDGTQIICKKTDSVGHYYIKYDLTGYKDYYYFITDTYFDYPSSPLTVGTKNTYNIKKLRYDNNVVVYGNVSNKITKALLDSISINLLYENVPYRDFGIESKTYTKKDGTYKFDFLWDGTDTFRTHYFLFVPENNLFYKSDTIKVPYGKDSEINIELTPKP